MTGEDSPPFFVLTLDEDELRAAEFARGYGWGSAIAGLDSGANELNEDEARAIAAAIDSDMEGGHDAFPCLDFGSRVGSDLADKLMKLWRLVNED